MRGWKGHCKSVGYAGAMSLDRWKVREGKGRRGQGMQPGAALEQESWEMETRADGLRKEEACCQLEEMVRCQEGFI
ncbi:hypothetical protein TWF506_008645 [Arthrobotrys conoides]|uniref:Uncharacterized protein n=1 Tax=Arthrobotrys conoides TaxID=74498 RepID=A0AAN8RU79_9PEZI